MALFYIDCIQEEIPCSYRACVILNTNIFQRIFRASYQASDLGKDLIPTITVIEKRASVAGIDMAEGKAAEVYQ